MKMFVCTRDLSEEVVEDIYLFSAPGNPYQRAKAGQTEGAPLEPLWDAVFLAKKAEALRNIADGEYNDKQKSLAARALGRLEAECGDLPLLVDAKDNLLSAAREGVSSEVVTKAELLKRSPVDASNDHLWLACALAEPGEIVFCHDKDMVSTQLPGTIRNLAEEDLNLVLISEHRPRGKRNANWRYVYTDEDWYEYSGD